MVRAGWIIYDNISAALFELPTCHMMPEAGNLDNNPGGSDPNKAFLDEMKKKIDTRMEIEEDQTWDFAEPGAGLCNPMFNPSLREILEKANVGGR